MKELSIEEKAKAYDKAIEKARKLATDLPNGRNDRIYHIWDLESIFPELRESEDEKIRKELIEHIKDQQSSFISAPDCRDKYEEEENNKYNSWIAWLEKQGKKNSVTTKEEEKVREQVVYAINKLNVPGSEKNKLLAWLEKQGEQKPAWSEEDETMATNIIIMLKEGASLRFNKNDIAKGVDWLKSLKQRMGG